MEAILKSPHWWIMFVLVTCAQAVFFKRGAAAHIREQPELAQGYAALIRGWLFWGNLPWVVMGLGLESGAVPGFWHYFRPRDGNPYVLAWYGCVVALWILGFRWIFRRGGAQMLARHSRIFHGDLSSPAQVKFFYLLCVGAGVAGLVFLVVMEVPLPLGSR
jgi:hypothetical protein